MPRTSGSSRLPQSCAHINDVGIPRTRLERAANIATKVDTIVTELHGDGCLEGVTLTDHHGASERIDTPAVFAMIGAEPRTGWLDGVLSLDPKGFVLTGPEAGGASPYETSMPGVFAVGDVRSASIKRVASAVGESSVVVHEVHRYLAAPDRSLVT